MVPTYHLLREPETTVDQKGDLPLWEGNAFQSLFRNVQVQLRRAKDGALRV